MSQAFDTAIKASEGKEGHRLKLGFDDGLYVTLVHPEAGCKPPSVCAVCAADLRDPDAKRCYDCKDLDPDGDECWLTAWVEEQGDELIRGEITVPVEVEWRDDYTLFHLLAGSEVERLRARQLDCGVCGIPETVMVEVCAGYAVPRCKDHRDQPPYQAEARLHSLLENPAEACS